MKEKVLLVCLDNLGDAVFSSSLIAPLRKAFPGGVGMWTKEYVAGLGPFLGVDWVFSSDPFWDRSPGRGRGSFLAWMAARRQVAGARFDAAVTTSLSWKALAGLTACGIPRRIGFGGGKRHFFLTDAVAPPGQEEPALESLRRLLKPLGVGENHLELALKSDPFRMPLLKSLSQGVPDGPLAALHPFAGSPARCVALEQWVRVAEALKELGFGILWVGSRKDLESVRSGRPREIFSCEFGGGSLGALGGLFLRCAFFIGHDSGPLHLASALGLRVAGVFAPGEPSRTFPQGRGPSVMIKAKAASDLDAGKILRSVPRAWVSRVSEAGAHA